MYLLNNALPDDIKELKPVHKFKFKVKSFLLQNCFYTIRDYTDREKEKIMFIVTKQRYSIMN